MSLHLWGVDVWQTMAMCHVVQLRFVVLVDPSLIVASLPAFVVIFSAVSTAVPVIDRHLLLRIVTPCISNINNISNDSKLKQHLHRRHCGSAQGFDI